MAKRRKNNLKRFAYFILGLSTLIFAFSLYIFIYGDIPLQTQTYYAHVKVSGKVGLNVNNTALIFGNIPIGGSSTRILTFENNYDFPIELHITSKGEISKVITHPGTLQIQPGHTEKIGFSAVLIEGDENKEYDGHVTLKIFRAD